MGEAFEPVPEEAERTARTAGASPAESISRPSNVWPVRDLRRMPLSFLHTFLDITELEFSDFLPGIALDLAGKSFSSRESSLPVVLNLDLLWFVSFRSPAGPPPERDSPFRSFLFLNPMP